MTRPPIALAFVLLALAGPAAAQSPLRPITLDPAHNHRRYDVRPADHVVMTRAYVASFDSADDDDGDGTPDRLGVPQWVAYQLDADPPPDPAIADDRPGGWMPVPDLPIGVESPTDESYRNSGYSRGHLCRREDAGRLGADANFNSFCLANACPQDQAFNAGIWNALERKVSEDWVADAGRLWIICGPIFADGRGGRRPTRWIGDGAEVRVAVPGAFYKIIVREAGPTFGVLAYRLPHDPTLRSGAKDQDLSGYLVAVDELERATGLDFLANLPPEIQAEVEARPAGQEWPLAGN